MPYHVGASGECPEGKPHAVIKDSDGMVMGCHSSKEDAQRQIAAIHANEGVAVTTAIPLAVSAPTVTGDGYGGNTAFNAGTPWEGVLAMEDVETGDGRMFSPGAITWADMPLPLRRNIEDSHGGQPITKAVLVGRIDKVWRDPIDPMKIMGAGVFDDEGEHGAEALRLVRQKFLKGISVDPDDIKDSDVELIFPEGAGEEDESGLMDLFAMPEMTLFHAGRLRGATLVDIPAFVEANIWLVDPNTVPQAITAAAAHFGQVSDRTWNAANAEQRLPSHMPIEMARRAYAHVPPGLSVVNKAQAHFMHHEVEEDGEIGLANLTACSVNIRVINSGRATGLTAAEQRFAYEHMAHHLRAAGLTPAPFASGEVITASIAAGIVGPPREWFEMEEPTELTPITVTDEVTSSGWRRIYGHGAEWGNCHMSFGEDVCTVAPREPDGQHTYFRLGETVFEDNTRMATGLITLGTGHAPTRGMSAQRAVEHYDNTGTIVAQVASSEGKHGIWLAGAIPPWVSGHRVLELQAAGKVSGDWRRIGGKLRLVAMLACNVPGFAIPRLTTHVLNGKQQSLVAAGILTDHTLVQVDPGVHAAMQRIARSIGRDSAARMAALKVRVKGV